MNDFYLIDAPLDEPFPLNKKDFHQTIPHQSTLPHPNTPLSKDQLVVDSGWEKIVYILVFLMIVAIVIAVGAFSKKVEHAIAFSLLLSAIAFLFLFVH